MTVAMHTSVRRLVVWVMVVAAAAALVAGSRAEAVPYIPSVVPSPGGAVIDGAGAVRAHGDPPGVCRRSSAAPAEERALMRRVRAYRRSARRPNVTTHRGLRRAARVHSTRLVGGVRLLHSVRLPYQGSRRAGQNLARARDARTAMRLMIGSRTHRRVLLSRAYRYAGIGAVVDCHGMVTYTLNFISARVR